MIFVLYHKQKHKCTISTSLEEEEEEEEVSLFQKKISQQKKKKKKKKCTRTPTHKQFLASTGRIRRTQKITKLNSFGLKTKLSRNTHTHTRTCARTLTQTHTRNTNTLAPKSNKGALVGRYLVVTYLPR
jgi:hypothetical protein